MKKEIGIVWLREDFRLMKNEALSYASNNHEQVSVIYIYKENIFSKRKSQKWWLYKSLKAFKKTLDKLNINLELIKADSYKEVFEKMPNDKFFSLYWNKVYEPQFLNFDVKLSKLLKSKNINFNIFKGNLLNESDEIKKVDNTPFKVFTAFWRTAEKYYIEKEFNRKRDVKPNTKKISFFKKTEDLKEILPENNWYKKFENLWSPSEEEALSSIKNFIKKDLINYGDNRDIPGISGTSKISPYLAFGQIHVETIWEECQKTKTKGKGYRKYINELGWREFSHSLINYFPEMLTGNLKKEFNSFPWSVNKNLLDSWKKGATGYPIVDAGMRELYETGWIHNRVRMIVASFLVKHLRIHWKEGEKHFRNCLHDFNEANNVAGWQWVAGSGADAAPYFRIFNPILQGEKFDKKGVYVKKWLPELKNIPDEFVHKPWELKDAIKNFELGKTYPYPIVDHKEAREAALNAFKSIKK
ncbi:DNA photolyase family protein [Pelagibacteraceae bacterium]|nr:DNA photolyase family protein [Pelagibacteraceae bacterium]